MFFKTLTLVLSLASAVTAYPGVKRESETQTGIYAYGSHISGLTVYGGSDGSLYVSSCQNTLEISPNTRIVTVGKAYITEANSTNPTLEELICEFNLKRL